MCRPAEASSYCETPSPEKAKTNVVSFRRKQQHSFQRVPCVQIARGIADLIRFFGFHCNRQILALIPSLVLIQAAGKSAQSVLNSMILSPKALIHFGFKLST